MTAVSRGFECFQQAFRNVTRPPRRKLLIVLAVALTVHPLPLTSIPLVVATISLTLS